jgi:nitrate/nitrite transporter NarK
VILGFVVLAILPNRPAKARWLTPDQRDAVEREIAADHQSSHHHVAEFWDAVCNSHLWLLSTIYFMFMMGFFGVIYWMPSMIKDMSEATDFQVGLISAIPYLLATVSMVIIGHHADRHNERRWHAATTLFIAAAGIALVSLCHSTPALVACLCIAAVGCWSTIAPFWTLSTRYLQAGAAAGGIATVNSIGCLAGFASPYIMGWLKGKFGSYTGGLMVIAASLVLGAMLILSVPREVDRADSSPTAV